MKKLFVFLAASVAFISCESLEQDEYKITGSVNGDTFDGKEIYIEKRGDGGLVAVDTAKIESGKFEFKGKVEEPTIHFISIEGMPMQKANFFLEHGNIKLEVDKDTLYKTVSSGTYNNDMLQDYYTKSKVNTDKMRKFKTKNQEIIRNATMSGDTATYNKLEKEGKLLQEAKTKTDMDFIRENPKAHINLYIFGDLLGNSDLEVAKLRKLFDAIDPVVKNTEDGKQIAEYFTMMEAQEKAKENVSAGKKAPDFSAPTPDGSTLSLKDAMGKVTVIDFWASWCKPCRMENPNVVAMYNELHSQGLNIIGVSLDKDADAWKKAIADDKLTWNHVSNLKFWEDPIAKEYGVQSIPATFVLDKDGNIVAKDLRGEALKAKVKELLAQ